MFYDRFLELCNHKGIKPSPAAAEAGISKSLVTKWKKNSSEVPSMDILEKLAKYFGVPVSDLLAHGLVRCEECGFLYDSDDPEERETHRINHEMRRKAIEKFGFCWEPIQCGEKKADAREIVNDESESINKRIEAQIIVFKSLFSRSLTNSHFDLAHPDFNSYVAMILMQGKGKQAIPCELYDSLVDMFGTKDGISAGTLYQKENPSANNNADRGGDVLNLLTENELHLVRKYAEHLIDLRHKQ